MNKQIPPELCNCSRLKPGAFIRVDKDRNCVKCGKNWDAGYVINSWKGAADLSWIDDMMKVQQGYSL